MVPKWSPSVPKLSLKSAVFAEFWFVNLGVICSAFMKRQSHSSPEPKCQQHCCSMSWCSANLEEGWDWQTQRACHEMEQASIHQSSLSNQPGCYSCSGLEVMSKSKAGLVNSRKQSIDLDLTKKFTLKCLLYFFIKQTEKTVEWVIRAVGRSKIPFHLLHQNYSLNRSASWSLGQLNYLGFVSVW